ATASKEDETVRIWDPATGQMLGELRGHEGGVACLTFHTDGRRLATVSGDGWGVRKDRDLRFWDLVTGRELTRVSVPTKKGRRFKFFLHNARCMVDEYDAPENRGWVWEADWGASRIRLWHQECDISHVSVSPDGRRLVTVSEYGRKVLLWDGSKAREL